MRTDLKSFLGKLGINYEMEPYGSQPWQVADEESGITCSAEVRVMDSNIDEIEAEIMFQNPSSSDKPIDIVLWLQVKADPKRQYQISKCKFHGEDFAGKTPGWQEKICLFYKMCVAELEQFKIPDIEAIEKDVMKEDASGTGKRGRSGSGKFQRINTNMLMHDMKAGGGF